MENKASNNIKDLYNNLFDYIIQYGRVGININQDLNVSSKQISENILDILTELFLKQIIVVGKNIETPCMFEVDLRKFPDRIMANEYGYFKIDIIKNNIEISDVSKEYVCPDCKPNTISNNLYIIDFSDLKNKTIDPVLLGYVTPTNLRLANIVNNIFNKILKEYNLNDTIFSIYLPDKIKYYHYRCVYCNKFLV